MNENNLPNEELENKEEVDVQKETEATYEAEEIEAQETVEEADEYAEENDAEAEAVVEAEECECGCACEHAEENSCKCKNGYKTSAIIAWVLVVVLAGFDVYYYMTNIFNKYNHMGYLNVNGYTIGEVVAGMGMDFDEFKEMYGLPADMRKDTYMDAAQSLIPITKMAEMNGVDFEGLKANYKFGEEITEKSTWGEAVESMALRDYVGEAQFEEFKTQFELGEEVTLDTKWGDIRKEVEKKQIAERLANEAEKAEAENKPAEDEPVADDTAAPAEDDAAADGAEEPATDDAAAETAAE